VEKSALSAANMMLCVLYWM